MSLLKRWEGIKAVSVVSDREKLEDLWDASFDIILETEAGPNIRLGIRGGNGGAYGADLSLDEAEVSQ